MNKPAPSLKPETPKRDARAKLLGAAFSVIRTKGFAGASVDDLCREAGVTKGAFFHHFKSKDDLAVAAADHWTQTTSALFAAAPYHAPKDPLDRLLAYIDFRRDLIAGDLPDFTCLVGTMVQECYETNHAIRDASYASIKGHAATLQPDIEAAMKKYKVKGVDAASLALHTQAVLQGAFILAKGANDAQRAIESIAHLHRYFELLFSAGSKKAAA